MAIVPVVRSLSLSLLQFVLLILRSPGGGGVTFPPLAAEPRPRPQRTYTDRPVDSLSFANASLIPGSVFPLRERPQQKSRTKSCPLLSCSVIIILAVCICPPALRVGGHIVSGKTCGSHTNHSPPSGPNPKNPTANLTEETQRHIWMEVGTGPERETLNVPAREREGGRGQCASCVHVCAPPPPPWTCKHDHRERQIKSTNVNRVCWRPRSS